MNDRVSISSEEKTRILHERTETYSNELSDLLWPNWAPHEATIAVEPKANLNGSYRTEHVETITVEFPKSIKAKVEIRTAKGSDDKWRGASVVVNRHTGSYSSPSVHSEPFNSKENAISNQIGAVRESLASREKYEYIQRKRDSISKAIEIFNQWSKQHDKEFKQMGLFA